MWQLSLTLIIFLLFGPLAAGKVNAQQAIAPELYTAIERRLAAEQALKGKDLTKLTPQELQKVINESLAAGVVPQVGNLEEKDGAYIFSTGLSGTALAQIPKGEYMVSLAPLAGISINAPPTFLAKSAVKNELVIGMRANTFFARLVSFISRFIKKPAAFISSVPSASSKVPVQIRLFQDSNGNGQIDLGEKNVAWANVKITLRKISTEQALSLKQGINTVRFSKLPKNIETAYQLLNETIFAGGREATVIAMTSGVPQSANLKDGNFYGEDFALTVDTDYVVKLANSASLTLIETVGAKQK